MVNQIATLKMEQRFKRTPAGDIPVDWEYQRLGDAARFINGHGFRTNEWADSGLPIIRIQNLNGGSEYNFYQGTADENWIVEPGDLLFSWSGSLGTSFGPYIWSGPRAVLNQHIFCVKNCDHMDRGFLYQVLKQVTAAIEQRAHGSAGLVHITKRELENFEIPAPPLAEQQSISRILTAVDIAEEKLRQVADKLETLKKEFTQELLAAGVGTPKHRLKTTPIGRIPEHWDVVKLNELVREPIRNGYSPLCPDKPTGKWTLGLGALSEIGFQPAKAKPAPLDDPKTDDFLLQPGDLLASRSNTRELVGLASTYRGVPENCIYPDLMIRIRVATNKISSDYLELYLLSANGRRYFQSEARGTSGSMVKINGAILGRMLIPVPPLDEQHELCSRVAGISTAITTEKRMHERISSLRQSLMSVLIAGRLRTTGLNQLVVED